MRGAAGFSALGLRDFRYFWIGQVVSFSGTWLQSTAQGWLVYSLTGSPFYLGLVAAAASAPILMLSLLGGAVADRFPKRGILLLTQGLSILPALAIGVLTSTGAIEVRHVVALAFVLGAINAFDIPTRQSFLLEMVGRGNLLNAIALNSAAFNGARVIGPMLAGFTIAHVGVAACFYLNALSFVAVVFALMRIEARGEPSGARTGIVREIRQGVGFIFGEPCVRRPMLLVMGLGLFAMPFVTLLPAFAVEVLGVGARELGFMVAASGLGAFAAAVAVASMGDPPGKERLMAYAAVVLSLALMGFAHLRSFPLALGVLAVAGCALMGMLAMANGTVQLRAPDALRGRVMSVYTLMFLGMVPVGNVLMGWLADIMGTVAAMKSAAGVCMVFSAAALARTLCGGKEAA